MIDPHIRFEGFDARSWTHLLSLFAPGLARRPEARAGSEDAAREGRVPSGAEGNLLVVVDEDDHPLAALHSLHGRVQVDSPVADPRTLCATHGARRCFVLREGALEELGERLVLRLDPKDDYLEQCLATLQTLREMMDAGQVRAWPRRFASVPLPSAAAVMRALDLVLPDGRAAVMALWDGPHLWTAVALRRQGGRLDWVAGPDTLARMAGSHSGPLEGSEAMVRGVGAGMAPVHVGIFAEVAVVKRLLREAVPGEWAAAVASGQIHVQPMPVYVAVALGADTLRAVTRSSARILGDRVSAALPPFASAIRARLGRARSLTDTLGFNPLELLSRFLRS
jgi:hypothetical protein